MTTLFFKTALVAAALALTGQASAEISFYENDGFQGRSFSTQKRVGDFQRFGFNDRASSVAVGQGERWEVCENSRLQGRCTVLRPGRYPSLSAMGLNDRVSSVRPVRSDERIADDRYAPMPQVTQDFRRRRNERLFDAPVTSVRAVVGTPSQRCWIEREHVTQDNRGGANVPGAVVGALIGGILGHQVGGGSGKDIATVGGVVGGAALGSRVGRDGNQQVVTQEVRRCDNNPAQAQPAFWDVTYNFRGQDHRVQMSTPPGPTVTVNRNGEPRGS